MHRILVVEEIDSIRKEVCDILDYVGYHTLTAVNGMAALRIIRKERPHLVLSNAYLPKIDGFKLLMELLADESISDIPLILFSTNSNYKDFRRGMTLGADDYLMMPFDKAELITAINSRLHRVRMFKNSGIISNTDTKTTTMQKFTYEQKVFFNDEKNPRFINISDIVALTADKDYTNLILADGSKIYWRRLLADWQKLLPENHFLRIHRSTLINLEYISKVEKWFKRSYKIYLKNTDQYFISSERFSILIRKVLGA